MQKRKKAEIVQHSYFIHHEIKLLRFTLAERNQEGDNKWYGYRDEYTYAFLPTNVQFMCVRHPFFPCTVHVMAIRYTRALDHPTTSSYAETFIVQTLSMNYKSSIKCLCEMKSRVKISKQQRKRIATSYVRINGLLEWHNNLYVCQCVWII